MKSGIYQIINLINKKIYVGSASYFNNRWSAHKFHLNRNSHYNKYLQNAWNKYGEENFEFKILEIVEDKTKLIEKEQAWINWLKPLYNLSSIAGSNLGIKYSKETKQKMSIWQIGRKMSNEAKRKMSIAAIGRQNAKGIIHTKEFKENCRKRQLGTKHSEEHKFRIGETHRKLREKFLHQNLLNYTSGMLSLSS